MATLRNDPLKLFLKRIGTLVLILVVVGVALAVWDVYGKERDSRALRAQAEMQRDELAAQSERLSRELEKLRTERGKEEALREQYDLGRLGEHLIVIVEPPTPELVHATSTFIDRVKKLLIWW